MQFDAKLLQLEQMDQISILKSKLDQYFSSPDRSQFSQISIGGPQFDQWPTLWDLAVDPNKKWGCLQHILVFEEESQAQQMAAKLSSHENSLFVPGLESSPYTQLSVIDEYFQQKIGALSTLARKNTTKIPSDGTPSEYPRWITTSYQGLHCKLPAPDFFTQQQTRLVPSDIFSPQDLEKKLLSFGYEKVAYVASPGEFARKGEIFDLFSAGSSPARLIYFDEMIEEIFAIEPETQRTLRNAPLDFYEILPEALSTSTSALKEVLRKAIPMPKAGHQKKYLHRQEVLKKLGQGGTLESLSYLLPLGQSSPVSLLNYFSPASTLIHYSNESLGKKDFEQSMIDLSQQHQRVSHNPDSDNIFPGPEAFYFSGLPALKSYASLSIDSFSQDPSGDSLSYTIATQDIPKLRKSKKREVAQRIAPIFFNQINQAQSSSAHVYLLYQSNEDRDLLVESIKMHLGEDLDWSKLTLVSKWSGPSFWCQSQNAVFLQASDFILRKSPVKDRRIQGHDLFAEQMSTLKVGDFVIHQDHGIGIYRGMENLKLGNEETDFLLIEYQELDKIYVPVYRFHLIQKYGDDSANCQVANLRQNRFQKAKEKARHSAKKLAFDLIALQAKREQQQAYAFSDYSEEDEAFAKDFPFQETPDQEKAIQDVLEDMMKDRPMDRLVCGDVGLGKTEIAMRAAFKAVMDDKQVAVLVPTTLLAMQHYQSFKKRFAHFAVTIDGLSRMKTAKESKEILKKLSERKLDIVIGTHKILGPDVEFADLGLVIIDEEHRFGVNHKEKLKTLKQSVDVLAMTATPIPRTLQLSYLGLRDLSLVQTPPPFRQSISTYVVRGDDETLKAAIESELTRGGQIYVVHNRVQDIEIVAEKIQKLAPRATLTIGHGQLPEKELEKRIQAFYDGKFDILLATTIIESGIDIPNANTLIVNRADKFGLAQLHQLRGRIGRSDRRAFAYFLIPSDFSLSSVATKRLRALQNYSELGQGLHLAGSDLEIRGAGDILGAEQSGHIESVGLELYLDLLKEAIEEIGGQSEDNTNINVEIVSSWPAFLPDTYVTNPSQRLRYYKKLSNAQNLNHFEGLCEEITDQFGAPPREAKHLFDVMALRFPLQKLGIQRASLTGQRAHLRFSETLMEKKPEWKNQLIEELLKAPNIFQIRPDQSVICRPKKTISVDHLSDFASYLSQFLPTPR